MDNIVTKFFVYLLLDYLSHLLYEIQYLPFFSYVHRLPLIPKTAEGTFL